MGWWQRLFGGSGQEPAQPPAGFPVTIPLIPDQLSARVHLHEIPTGPRRLPCWTYVTSGLWAAGQKEMILSLLRRPDEPPEAFPQDPLYFFAQVHQLARSGQLVDVGGRACLLARGGSRGSTALTGFIDRAPGYSPDVERPPWGRALTAVLLPAEGAEVVQFIGSSRLPALRGQQPRHYPCPPWSERG